MKPCRPGDFVLDPRMEPSRSGNRRIIDKFSQWETIALVSLQSYGEVRV